MSKNLLSNIDEVMLVYKSSFPNMKKTCITSSLDAFKIFKENWSEQIGIHEEFNLLLLDQANHVLAMSNLSKGGISSTIVDLRIAFATALKARASSIILAHNHPSGNLKPSKADITLTEKFKNAGGLLDIQILDHLIVTPNGRYYSFADDMMI